MKGLQLQPRPPMPSQPCHTSAGTCHRLPPCWGTTPYVRRAGVKRYGLGILTSPWLQAGRAPRLAVPKAAPQ